MNRFDDISVDISVVLGKSEMPVHQLLRMGRGAVIELDTHEADDVTILANSTPVAEGQVTVVGDKVGIVITKVLQRAVDMRPVNMEDRI
ncbi:Flagellar motor switch protein FliN [Pseudovibrio sp. W64]|jgi:flagellar motor switch protein FliN/FliY|uniref:Flagellar motor switch protein FliN/FliY n=1 Tax=Pseudovibrio ascidiaceicola TaxID=285279 RepID=A0A1I4EUK5_9HYPH|nr:MULTISPECIES: FliM/FliN family flagellar motor switch protein [Pseudovibrio]KZK78906.1 Flagellar motor switch protein FliN [Pseudovibrio sp. Ad46]KZK79452.1 Flagellar motor switch protein FliN [Pseudovibrio sp. W64]KZK81140.1 Flagellar motor switch protein FliN [Pseudovibrio sp. Ad13]KZK93287.1 Flagellar motor switch protein FliN [Pseudovibrio sp. Ad5]KZL00648.1 Flagellar motor switch protein FliN [Pseudovibrio sp. W74]